MRIFNSILISIMLILNTSAISAQEKQKAQLYMTNGTILSGEIISTKKDMVTFKYFSNSTISKTRAIPFEMVRRLFSSDGALIIINGHYSLAYFESTALISRANEEWVIIGSNGILANSVIPIVMTDDSLIFYHLGARVSVNIENVEEVSLRRNVSVLKRTLRGTLIGFVAGALISEVVDPNSSCFDDCPIEAFIFTPFGTILGTVIGFRLGKNKDIILDLRGLSHSEKQYILQNEFGFYTNNPS